MPCASERRDGRLRGGHAGRSAPPAARGFSCFMRGYIAKCNAMSARCDRRCIESALRAAARASFLTSRMAPCACPRAFAGFAYRAELCQLGPAYASLPHHNLRRTARRRHRRRACGCRAGATASATTAGCCSSICATITASPSAWPIRIRRPSSSPRSCARNGWCGSTARCARVRPAPRIRTCRPARSRSSSPRSRCWGRPANCRCRCSAIRNIRRKSGSNTASLTCAATACTPTS